MVQLALCLTACFGLLLACIVLISNYKKALYRTYFALGLMSSLWMLVNALSIPGLITLRGSLLLAVSRLITPTSLLTLYFFLLFVKSYKDIKLNFSDLLFSAAVLIILILSPTKYNVYMNSSGGVLLGPLYPAYMSVLLYGVVLIFVNLYSKRDFTVKKTLQIRYLKVGALGTIIPTILLGAILPLFSNSSISNVAPLFSIVFLGAAAYAIVRHGLFNINLLVARTISYILSIIILFGFFMGIAYMAGDIIFANFNVGIQYVRLGYAVIAVFLALSFPSIQKIFRKLTNSLFYRDAYEVQKLISDYNKVLASTYRLEDIVRKSSLIIENNLKSITCITAIVNDGKLRFANAPSMIKFTEDDLVYLNHILLDIKSDIITTATLEYGKESYSDFLHSKNIALVAKLDTGKNKIGYMVLGPKRSGNLYNRLDLEIIGILKDELAVAVQNALRTEEIENFNITLQDRVKNATYRLRRTNEKLRALDEAKDDFVSMASHQLRTPLTSVKGNISLVLDGDAGEIAPLQRQLLEQAFISSQRMVFLIADLLNVSRLKTGKFVIEPSEINLSHIVEEEVSQLVDTAKSRHLSLIYNKPDHITPLMLDETKTRQVIMNFVDNAIYYTPAGGKIEVVLSETPSSVECRVIDNGIGVPKNEQHHLFTKFYRANNARKARPDGTGLGLFMAKKVIIAEGGSIIFQTKEGEGSTFGFSFPKSRLAVSANIVGPNSAKKTEPALK